VQYDGNHGNPIRYSRMWHDHVTVIFPVIGPSALIKRSQSECLSHDPVGQLTPVWLYCCALQS